MTDEDIFSLGLYLIHEKARNISDSNKEDIVRKYGRIPGITNDKQRTRARQIIEDIESVINMETLYAGNNIDPSGSKYIKP